MDLPSVIVPLTMASRNVWCVLGSTSLLPLDPPSSLALALSPPAPQLGYSWHHCSCQMTWVPRLCWRCNRLLTPGSLVSGPSSTQWTSVLDFQSLSTSAEAQNRDPKPWQPLPTSPLLPKSLQWFHWNHCLAKSLSSEKHFPIGMHWNLFNAFQWGRLVIV